MKYAHDNMSSKKCKLKLLLDGTFTHKNAKIKRLILQSFGKRVKQLELFVGVQINKITWENNWGKY